MDYNGWVLSIYDEYRKRYDDKYEIKLSKWKRFKRIIKVAFTKKNVFPFMTITLYGILLAVILILLTLKVINTKSFINIFSSGTLLYILCFSPYMYKNEPELQSYCSRIEILRNVLKEQNIYNRDVIVELKNHTGNIFYKLGNFTMNVLIAAGFTAGIGEFLRRSDIQFFTYAVTVIIVAVIAIYSVYSIVTAIPNNRIVRRKNFHQLLKILLTNDFEGKSTSDIKESVNKNVQLKEKDIIETVVKALTK